MQAGDIRTAFPAGFFVTAAELISSCSLLLYMWLAIQFARLIIG